MLRADLEIIQDWIRPDSHILDLGCGDGTLLALPAGAPRRHWLWPGNQQ